MPMGGSAPDCGRQIHVGRAYNKEKPPSRGRRVSLPPEVDVFRKKAGLLAPIHPRIALPVSGGFELVLVTVAGAAGDFHPIPYSLYKHLLFLVCCIFSIACCVGRVKLEFASTAAEGATACPVRRAASATASATARGTSDHGNDAAASSCVDQTITGIAQ